ncbi:hypothetical protein GYA93_24245 [Gordonia desulfuricans]|uniref:DUF6575 domain-containing protein n=2 Tax=Gordonia desulfuricans TaxID=89051 RepID=A0A7K3LYR8_9ACTN|nr:DUF6575 domain-containing protein [Gordonia desulfuricans]NDK92627.1 hypothetical protein [Gordonia desulfuricans]
MYLAEWAGENDNYGDDWLFVPLTPERLGAVRSGGFPVRQAFTNPEEQVYSVSTYYDDGRRDEIQVIDAELITDDMLPASDFSLDLYTATKPPAVDRTELARRSRAENRTRLRIELDQPDMRRTEANTRDVGEILVGLQRLLDNVGLSKEVGPKSHARGPIPPRVSRKMASEVVELSAASFVVEIAATEFDDLFGQSLFADASREILSVLDPQLDRSAIAEHMSQLGPRAAKSFRRFVETLSSANSSVDIAGVGQEFSYTNAELSEERIAFLETILNAISPDEEVESIEGEMTLYAFDSDRFTFGLRDIEGKTYHGTVEEQARAHVQNPTINRQYRATVVAFSSLDDVIGENKISHRLRQLVPLDDGSGDG